MLQYLLEWLLWVEMRNLSLRSSLLVLISTNNQCIVGGANYVDGVSIIFVKVICAILHYLLGLALTVNLERIGFVGGGQWLDGLQPSGSLVALRWTSTFLRYFTLFYYFVEQ